MHIEHKLKESFQLTLIIELNWLLAIINAIHCYCWMVPASQAPAYVQ